jgi:hypothetical protein
MVRERWLAVWREHYLDFARLIAGLGGDNQPHDSATDHVL